MAKKKVTKKTAPKKAAKASKPAKKAVKKAVPAKKTGAAKAAKKPAAKNVKAKPAAKKVSASKSPAKKAAPKATKAVAKKPVAKVVKPAAKPVVAAPKKVATPQPKAQPAPAAKPVAATPKKGGKVDDRTRYTDKELVEFKTLINKKLEEATRDYELLKATLSHKDDHGTDDTSPTFKLLEDGSDVLSKEETAHLAARQEKYIQNLRNALIRIENKTYGVCRVTGKLIPKERLRSVPHATLSIDAKLQQNR
jgi:RNA polymerase-binding transcription factor DksA